MSQNPVPKPLSAYVGLLVASLEDAKGEGRSTAAQVAHLPLAAAGQLLTVRRRYDELAATGGVIIDFVVDLARQRYGAGIEESSDWLGDEVSAVSDRLATTPMQQIEQFSVPATVGAQAGGLKTAKDLPLEDFDHMSGPQLRGRLRTLDRVQLVQLLDYERAHADRVGIVLMLENRLSKLLAAQES